MESNSNICTAVLWLYVLISTSLIPYVLESHFVTIWFHFILITKNKYEISGDTSVIHIILVQIFGFKRFAHKTNVVLNHSPLTVPNRTVNDITNKYDIGSDRNSSILTLTNSTENDKYDHYFSVFFSFRLNIIIFYNY